jgi:hypothetical protein
MPERRTPPRRTQRTPAARPAARAAAARPAGEVIQVGASGLEAGRLPELAGGRRRVLVVPFQTDGLVAAERLGRWTARALSALRSREGGAILRLGDLLDLPGMPAAGPLLPPEPVALAVTGTPAFVGDLLAGLGRAAGRGRLVLQPLAEEAALPVVAVACDGALALGESPELLPHAAALAEGGWRVSVYEEGLFDLAVGLAAEQAARG